MKISEFIQDLEGLKVLYGDIDVEVLYFYQPGCCGQDWECDFSARFDYDVEEITGYKTLFIEGVREEIV